MALAAITILLIGWPIARLGLVALEDGPGSVIATLTDRLAATAAWNSLWTGAATAVIAAVAGTVAALVTERGGTAGRRWLRLGMLLPILVPPFVSASGWTRAYGPRGFLEQLAGFSVPGIYGPVGIVAVLSVAATPLAWLIASGALASRVEPDLERAARASGAGTLTTFRTVTLPLLRPALLAAAVVVFVFAINAFGVPAVLGTPAGFTTITTRLYQDLARSSDPAAFTRSVTMGLSLVALALVVSGSADALLASRAADRTGLPPGASATRRRGRAAALILGGSIVVTTIVPLVALALTALTRAAGLDPVPPNLTLSNFAAALDGRFLAGLQHSLVLAVAAATLVLLLGATTVAVNRGRSRILGAAVTLGFAVPGSALAVAVLLAYGWLRDSLAIILVAYLAKFWALGYRQLSGSVDRLAADQVWAARASGADALDALRSVVVPILRPSIAAGWIVVFVFSLHELTMSSLLYGPQSATLAVVVLNVQQLGDPTVSAALGILLTVIVALAATPLAMLGFGAGSERRRAFVRP